MSPGALVRVARGGEQASERPFGCFATPTPHRIGRLRIGSGGLLAAATLLAACAPPPPPLDPAGYAPLDHALPAASRLLLPRGVTAADARVRVNCYAYVSNGLLYAVRRPDGGQYCV